MMVENEFSKLSSFFVTIELMFTNPLSLSYFPKLREFIQKHERHVGTVSIFTGFIWDSFTLIRPDRLYENIIIVAYLCISAGGILLLTIYRKKSEVVPIVLLALVQFAFGNLAGGLLILYGRSGTFEGNYLFFFLFGAFLIGNEFLRSYYARLNFHISAWYFLLLSYSALIVPVALGRLGDDVFILSGATSLVLVFSFLFLLYKVSSQLVAPVMKKAIFCIALILTLFNIFYFLNILPPVPLSIREIGIYHSVERLSSGNYKVVFEKPEWYEFFRSTDQMFNHVLNSPVYCFSSIFAPVRLSTSVNHRWEYYNELTTKWQTLAVVPFSIAGGRTNGYRGYSQKSNIFSGRWRCSVETNRGTLIGRTTFTIIEGGVGILSEKEL
ncbi:MAG: DUF2914 domain-containing protein [Patescibacteria group bacterium]